MLETGLTSARFTPWMQAGQAPIWMQCHTAVVSILLIRVLLPVDRPCEARAIRVPNLSSLLATLGGGHEDSRHLHNVSV